MPITAALRRFIFAAVAAFAAIAMPQGAMAGENLLQKFVMNQIASLKRSCEAGDAGACNEVAVAYQEGGIVVKDQNLANEYRLKACELKDGLNCAIIGLQHQFGDTLSKDYDLAYSYYEKSCDFKFARGCFYKGNMNYFGIGRHENKELAFVDFQSACNLGHAGACFNVAIFLAADGNDSKDFQKALLYAKRAVELDPDIKDGKSLVEALEGLQPPTH